jgi:Zn-dependent M28 family amino/carboxypeptidase
LWRDTRPRPLRSVLFAIVTGEERGLLGSAALVEHPPVPRNRIAADINLDNFLILYPLRDVVALGGNQSTLGRTARDEASRLGLELIPDPRPEQTLFVRNDQFSFVLGGVPSVTIANGVRSADPSVDVPALWTKWFGTIYHTPKDTMAQAFNWRAAEQYVSLNFAIGRRVAAERARPTWNPGDFFGQRFGRR